MRFGEVLDGGLADLAAGRARPGERDTPDVGVSRERRPRGNAFTGDDVDGGRRHAVLVEEFREFERADRRLLGRLDDRRVPGRERRSDAPCEKVGRDVPRDDVTGDTEGLTNRVVDMPVVERDALAFDLVGQPPVVLEVARTALYLADRLRERLSVLEGLDAGESVRLLPDGPGDVVQYLTPPGGSVPVPGLEAILGDVDGLVHVGRGSRGDGRQRVTCRGVVDGKRLAGRRRTLGAVDQHPVLISNCWSICLHRELTTHADSHNSFCQ